MTVMPIPDITLVSNGEDEEVIDLEAVARVAPAKLEKDLVEVKAQNDGITQKNKSGQIDWWWQRRKRRMRWRRCRERQTRTPRKGVWCSLW